MFCVGCGGIDTTQLKACSLIVNGDEQWLKLSNGDKVQTLFSVSDVRELSKVFAQIRKEALDLTQITKKKELLQTLNKEYNDQMENMIQQQLKYLEAQIKILKDEKEAIGKENGGLLSTDLESSINTLHEELLRQPTRIKLISKAKLISYHLKDKNGKTRNRTQQLKRSIKKSNNFQKPKVSENILQQHQQDQLNNLKQYGFLSIDDFERYQNEVEHCTKAEKRHINLLRQIKESMFYAYFVLDQLRLSLKNYEQASAEYKEPNTQELNNRFIQVLQIQEKYEPEQLVIRVIPEVLPSFEKRVEGLKNPKLFKEKVLAPLLSEEMWPVVKSLVFAKNKDPKQKNVTFDEYSRDMLMRLYSSTDEDLRKKQKEFDGAKVKVSFIEDQITKAEERKASIQENLEKQLTALLQKLDIEFEKK